MSDICGYAGKILVVDLTSGDISTLNTMDYAETYIGGRALGARLYWENVPPECGALDPENCLIFCTGPAAGTLSPGGSRTSISTKSPAMIPEAYSTSTTGGSTGAELKFAGYDGLIVKGKAETGSRTSISTKSPAMIPEAYSTSTTGGSTGAELKFAGYDGLIVKGKAETPVYLHIEDDTVEILPADILWGMTVKETDRELKQLWGPETRIFMVGPSGEMQSRYAAIINDFSHATGQGGFGAVMGSKNLKAIAVRGHGTVKVANPKGLMDWHHADVYEEGPNPSSSIAVGTLMRKNHPMWPVTEEEGEALKATLVTPTDLDDYFTPEETLSDAILMIDDINRGNATYKFGGCFSCPGPCHLSVKYKDVNIPSISMNLCHQPGQFRAQDEKAFGKNWGRADYLFNALCSNYGMSVDVMGVEHEWFNDLMLAGYIKPEDLDLGDGFDMYDPEAWLDEAVVRKMVHHIAYREGWLWSLCADGPDRALDYFAAIDEGAKNIVDKYIIKKYFNSSDGASFPKAGAPIDTITYVMDYKYMHAIDEGAKNIVDKYIIKKYFNSSDGASFPKAGAPIDTITYVMDYKYMHHNPYQHWRNGSSSSTKAVPDDQKKCLSRKRPLVLV